jgi:3-hydroxy acid dehydrogenase/malonic semialdehyde reductase
LCLIEPLHRRFVVSLTVFITGASAGFGAAMARRFVADGHRVILTARRAERLAELAAELGAAAVAFPLDVLVNNAGLALGLGPSWDAAVADWDTMVATNVTGVLHVTRALLPGMVARNRGHIINIGSTAGTYPYPGGHVYGASKAFVTQFSLNLKADLIGTGVRVTDLEPGLVGGTEFSHVRFGGDAARAAAPYAGTQPLTAEDVAEAAAWVVGLPAHVNINRMEMMPTCQAPAALAVKRT